MASDVTLKLKMETEKSSVSATKGEIKDAYTSLFDDISQYWSKGFSSLAESSGKTLQSSLGQSIIDGCTDGFNYLGGLGDAYLADPALVGSTGPRLV